MEVLIQNLYDITWQQMVMWVIGGVLIYLAIVKEMEPTLLLPMGFGAILVNLPNSGAAAVIEDLFEIGINQQELGTLVGATRQTISLIERGDYNPSITLALRIAQVFHLPVEDVFYLTEEESS